MGRSSARNEIWKGMAKQKSAEAQTTGGAIVAVWAIGILSTQEDGANIEG